MRGQEDIRNLSLARTLLRRIGLLLGPLYNPYGARSSRAVPMFPNVEGPCVIAVAGEEPVALDKPRRLRPRPSCMGACRAGSRAHLELPRATAPTRRGLPAAAGTPRAHENPDLEGSVCQRITTADAPRSLNSDGIPKKPRNCLNCR